MIVSKNYDSCPGHYGTGKWGFLWEHEGETSNLGEAQRSLPPVSEVWTGECLYLNEEIIHFTKRKPYNY